MNDWLRRILNLPPQASTYARGIDGLHYAVIGATSLGATFVFLLAVYWLVRFRRRAVSAIAGDRAIAGDHPSAAETADVPNTESPAHRAVTPRYEFVLVGALLALFLTFWLVGATQYNAMRTPPPNAMTVYVTAKQWMWKFAYPNGRASMDVLTVPAHRPVTLVMTSRDVIHSFYVPAFRVKQDVLPGRYETLWFEANAPGRYAIACAEYCGVSHSRMGGEVQVLSDADYARWLEGRALEVSTPGDLASAGREAAGKRGCLACHTLDGQPHIGPTWAGLYGSEVTLEDGTRVVADEAYLTRSMMDPAAQVVRGYRAVMPTYFGLLEATEVASLVEFIRTIADTPPSPTILLPQVSPTPRTGSPGDRP